jgi:hypothetical protein
MKMRILLITIILTLAGGMLTGCCNPGSSTNLSVTLHPQETVNWCWAASGQMVMDYLGTSPSQCTQANNRFGRTDCCNIDLCPPPTEPPVYVNAICTGCVCGGWPEFSKYGFTSKHTTDAPLSWTNLKKQVSTNKYCKKRPYCFTWHWDGGGGHMMVVKGYLTQNGTRYVRILNPGPPCVGDEDTITYEEYVEHPGHHTHWDDYYDVGI